MAKIPNLEPNCGSWMIINRADGSVICEVYGRSLAEQVDQTHFEVLTTAEYLGRFNRLVKEAGGDQPSSDALKSAVTPLP